MSRKLQSLHRFDPGIPPLFGPSKAHGRRWTASSFAATHGRDCTGKPGRPGEREGELKYRRNRGGAGSIPNLGNDLYLPLMGASMPVKSKIMPFRMTHGRLEFRFTRTPVGNFHLRDSLFHK